SNGQRPSSNGRLRCRRHVRGQRSRACSLSIMAAVASTLLADLRAHRARCGISHRHRRSENIAQSLGPGELDPIQRKEFGLRAACETPRMLGLWLIFMPLLLSVLLYKIYRFGLAGALQSHRLRDAIVLGVCFVLLYVSPIPEKLARVA